MLERALDELGVTAPAHVLDVGTGTGQAAGILLGALPGGADRRRRRVLADDRAGARQAGVEGRALRRSPTAGACRTPMRASTSLSRCSCSRSSPSCSRVLAPGGWALFCYPMGPGTPIWFPTALVAPRLERAGFARGALGHGRPRRVDGRSPLSGDGGRRAGHARPRLAEASLERDGRRLATTSSRLASRSRSRRAACCQTRTNRKG